MAQSRNAYRVLMGKPEGKRPLGRPRRRWEDNIKTDLREVGCDPRDWIALPEDRDQWRAYVRAVMNFRVPWKPSSIYICGLVAHAVRRSTPTAGVPSSRLGHYMLVSWWTKRGLGRFFSGFLPFSRTTNFIQPFLHAHLIHFVSFHQPLWWCVRRGRPASLLFTDLQHRDFIASHPSTRPCVGHELRIFIFFT